MDTSTPPQVLPELVEWLEKLFPNRLPANLKELELIPFLIGQQAVIRKLRKVMDEQISDSLAGGKEAP